MEPFSTSFSAQIRCQSWLDLKVWLDQECHQGQVRVQQGKVASAKGQWETGQQSLDPPAQTPLLILHQSRAQVPNSHKEAAQVAG